jgi:hypothetical protein
VFPVDPPLRAFWETRPFVVHSPLPPYEAAARLQQAISRGGSWPSRAWPRVTFGGYASIYDVVIQPRRVGRRTGPIPRMRGQIFATADGGSQLVAEFRAHLYGRAALPVGFLVWLCGAACAITTTLRAGAWSLVAFAGAFFAIVLLAMASEVSQGVRDERLARGYVRDLLVGVELTPAL